MSIIRKVAVSFVVAMASLFAGTAMAESCGECQARMACEETYAECVAACTEEKCPSCDVQRNMCKKNERRACTQQCKGVARVEDRFGLERRFEPAVR